ncbi:MAG: hypothetical protein A3F12_00820 [Gammaproteobacteria bacterium RIFCSPHIGHO2_12_FULL_38_14]|nr:MAG: hypothetical protein A3F12_00820 [Gammaproteobacteria bacterium RIFCSPHIGHO2_12_FULL_38_14]
MNKDVSSYRILITGATGFIGSALAKFLFQRGFQVRALTRDIRNTQVTRNPHYEWIEGDLTDSDQIQALCHDIDIIFHVAGFAHDLKNGDKKFQEMHKTVNEEASIRLAELAVKAGVKRFIFFSSIKATKQSDACTDESWVAEPEDAYGKAKRGAEKAIESIAAHSDMAVVVFRLSLVYGPGWKGNLNAMLKAIDRNRMPPIPNCNNKKSMISLYDVCEASWLAATRDLKPFQLFILTDGVQYSTYDIYAFMRNALGKKPPRVGIPFTLWRLAGKLGDMLEKLFKKSLPINSDKIHKLFGNSEYRSLYSQNELGFIPNHRFSDVLPEIIAHYREEQHDC